MMVDEFLLFAAFGHCSNKMGGRAWKVVLGQGFAKLQQHLEEHTDIVKSTAILFKMTNFENLIRTYKNHVISTISS